MDLSGLYEKYAPLVGALAGDSFNIMRPNYNQVDNTPVLVQAGVRFRCDTVTGRFAEPRFEGVGYYDLFGPRNLIQTGDILMRSTPDGMTPPVTVATFMPIKTTTGFRTSRICSIVDSAAEEPASVIYSNVYFDWLGQGFPGTTLNRGLLDSLPVPSQRVVIYARPNITRLRSHLVETDLNIQVPQPDGSTRPFQRTWIIDEVDYSAPLLVLTLRNK